MPTFSKRGGAVRVIIRSRFGNAVLAFLGVVYFLSATGTLVYYVVSNWGANHLTDLVLQAALLAAAAAGVFFVLTGIENLKGRRRDSVGAAHSARDRRTGAASAS